MTRRPGKQGHLFLFTQQQITPTIKRTRRIPVSTAQLAAGARAIQHGELLVLATASTSVDARLWATAKARTGVVHPSSGRAYVGLHYASYKTAKTAYLLCEGIALGETLKKTKWKPLEEDEVAACLFDTCVWESRAPAVEKAIAAAVLKRYGIPPARVWESVLCNGGKDGRTPVFRRSYDDEVLLSHPRYREALGGRLAQLDGKTFERFLEAFFRIPAFDLEVVRGPQSTSDGGIDVHLVHRNRALGSMRAVAQCKRWTKNRLVDLDQIKAFSATVRTSKSCRGIFITTSGFTKPALEFARTDPSLHLIDGAALADLLFGHLEKLPEIWDILRKEPSQPSLL